MADTVDQAMIVSVKGAPIEVPGRVLDPGKYVLRFPDIEHNFVDISTAAGDQIGFYQVVPISRPVRKDSAQLVLANRKNSVPELKAFFYPGMKTGYKFLYPTAQVSPVVQARASNISPGRWGNGPGDAQPGLALFVKPGCKRKGWDMHSPSWFRETLYFGDILKPEYRPLAHQMRAAKSAAPLDLEAVAWKRIDKSRAAQLEKQLLPGAVLMAQARRGAGSPVYDPKTEITAKGTVEEVQQQASGRRGLTGTHLMLKTDSGTFDVHVGPSDYIAKQDFSFAKGDQIEVTGSKVKVGASDVLIAREIKKGGKTLTLRNAQGIPAWSRGRRRPG